MTNQEINDRVAMLCGWFPVEDTESGLWHLSNMDGRKIGYRSGLSEDHAWRVLTPNYAESLDACREFSDKMSNDDHLRFQDELVCILPVATCSFDEMGYDRRLVIDATPIQRCEAFLRLKGQWE